MRYYYQLVPVILIDIITAAFFALLVAEEEVTKVIPLFIVVAFYGLLSLVSLACFISLFPKYKFSSACIFLLSALRTIAFSISILALLTTEKYVVIQAWLGAVEHFIMVLVVFFIPNEYFSFTHTTHPIDSENMRGSDNNNKSVPLNGNNYCIENAVQQRQSVSMGALTLRKEESSEMDFNIDSSKAFPRVKRNRKLSINNKLNSNSLHSIPSFSTSAPSPSDLASSSSDQVPPPPPSPEIIEADSDLQASPPADAFQASTPLIFYFESTSNVIGLLSHVALFLLVIDTNDKVNWDSDPVLKAGISLAVWASIGYGISILVLEVVQVQKISSIGSFFSNTHTHGFAFALICGGMALRLFFDSLVLLDGVPLRQYLTVSGGQNTFIICGREVLTQIIPLGFHLFNIAAERYYTKNKSSQCNAGRRMIVVYLLVVMNFHWAAVGHVFEESPLIPTASQGLAICARAAAYAATMDCCFISMAFLSPMAHTFNQSYNFGIMRKSIHKIHIHRSLVFSGCTFSLLHIILHIIAWAIDPHTVSPGHTKELYEWQNTAVITGLVMFLCFAGAAISGHLSTYNKKIRYWPVKLHLPLTIVGFLAFFSHGKQKPLAVDIIISVFWICIGMYTLFFLVNPLSKKEVSKDTVWGEGNIYNSKVDSYIFLVLKYNNSSVVPPGSFFNIYSSTNSSLSFVHGHPFPVLSSRNRKLVFLVQCRIGFWKDQFSFTQHLVNLKPNFIHIQGPFAGPASSFIHFLSTLTTPAHVYLCGWNSGCANVLSILEHLKDFGDNYAIESINCIFSQLANRSVNEKIGSFVTDLVSTWDSNRPISIIESVTKDLQQIITMAGERPLAMANKQQLMETWRGLFGNCKRWVILNQTGREVEGRLRSNTITEPAKVLYFCGSEFRRELFGDWSLHIETIP